MDLLYAWCSAGLGALHALTHTTLTTALGSRYEHLPVLPISCREGEEPAQDHRVREWQSPGSSPDRHARSPAYT